MKRTLSIKEKQLGHQNLSFFPLYLSTCSSKLELEVVVVVCAHWDMWQQHVIKSLANKIIINVMIILFALIIIYYVFTFGYSKLMKPDK